MVYLPTDPSTRIRGNAELHVYDKG